MDVHSSPSIFQQLRKTPSPTYRQRNDPLRKSNQGLGQPDKTNRLQRQPSVECGTSPRSARPSVQPLPHDKGEDDDDGDDDEVVSRHDSRAAWDSGSGYERPGLVPAVDYEYNREAQVSSNDSYALDADEPSFAPRSRNLARQATALVENNFYDSIREPRLDTYTHREIPNSQPYQFHNCDSLSLSATFGSSPNGQEPYETLAESYPDHRQDWTDPTPQNFSLNYQEIVSYSSTEQLGSLEAYEDTFAPSSETSRDQIYRRGAVHDHQSPNYAYASPPPHVYDNKAQPADSFSELYGSNPIQQDFVTAESPAIGHRAAQRQSYDNDDDDDHQHHHHHSPLAGVREKIILEAASSEDLEPQSAISPDTFDKYGQPGSQRQYSSNHHKPCLSLPWPPQPSRSGHLALPHACFFQPTSTPCNRSTVLCKELTEKTIGGDTGYPRFQIPTISPAPKNRLYLTSKSEKISAAPTGSSSRSYRAEAEVTKYHLEGYYIDLPKRKNKNKTQRRRFDDQQKKQTAETRKRGACIRCKAQRLRCIPLSPENPLGPCLSCLKVNLDSKKTIRAVGCLHYNLVDLQLSRQGGLNLTQRWEGTKLTDVEGAADSEVRPIEFKIFYTHEKSLPDFYDVPIRLEVHRFNPVDGDVIDRRWTWGTQRMVTQLKPFALHSVHTTSAVIMEFIQDHAFKAMTASVVNCDPIIKETYWMAIQHWHSLNNSDIAHEQEQRKFLGRLFKLWFAMRLSTGSAYLSGEETLGMKPETRPGYPLGDRISLPRMVTAQIDSILTTTIIHDETKELKRQINKFFRSNSPRYWFTIYLSTFILLHEISVATKDRGRYARQNQLSERFSLPQVVAAQHQSVNSLLAHWHYYKSDNDPSNTDIDDTQKTIMVYLNESQKSFIWRWWRWMTGPAIMNACCPDDPKEQDKHLEDSLYFISQMFISRWSPRVVFQA